MPQPSTSACVISCSTDVATAQALAEFRAHRTGEPVTVVFAEQEVADLYRDEAEVTALAWVPALAHEVAVAVPPHPLGRVAPPPIVVGDGMLARHLVGAFVAGWSEPGQPLQVFCLGAEPSWAQEAEEVTRPRGELAWLQLVPRPVPVARAITRMVDEWTAPPAGAASVGGVSVVVALADPATTLAVACAVASAVSTARVAAVVEDASIWPVPTGVRVFAAREARAATASMRRSPADRFVEQLFADIAWVTAPNAKATAPEAPIFGPVAYTDDGMALAWTGQPDEVRAQVRTLVDRAVEVFEAGSVVLEPAGMVEQPIVSTPSELSAMAAKILDLLRVPVTDGTTLTALELAARLPAIAGRAGWTCRRPGGYVPLLSFEQVERLSSLVHLAYGDVSIQTEYASGSPVAHQLWEEMTEFMKAGNRATLIGAAVVHAAAGMDWRAAQFPVPRPLTEGHVERLAELEHRRWAVFQRRNGAESHRWVKPWDGAEKDRLPEDVKEHDRYIVRQIPKILAGAGIEVVAS